jgi:threonine aldolase
MPKGLIKYLHDLGWKFYAFIGEKGCRLMCSWDTTSEDVRSFVEDLKRGLQSISGQS